MSSFLDKKGEAVTLMLVAVAILGLMGTAALLSTKTGNEVTGFAAATSTSCGTVAADLTLTADILNAGINCFNITASNIFLDCAGHIVRGSSVGATGAEVGIINISGVNHVTIKNCRLQNSTVGIRVLTAKNITIINNELTNFTDVSGSADGRAISFSKVNISNISYNNITNNSGGIILNDVINSSIIGNILENGYGVQSDSDNFDLVNGSTAPTQNNITLNAFYGNGTPGLGSGSGNNFCVSGHGNFYRRNPHPLGIYFVVPRNASDDCGALNILFPLTNQNFYNVSQLTINLSKLQDHPTQTNVQYVVRVTNATDSGLYNVGTFTGPTNFTTWDVSHVFANTSYALNITPFDGRFNGTHNTSGFFTVTNDKDADGRSVLAGITNGDDCNDANSSIRPPNIRENITNPLLANFCSDAIDDDCDASVDWLDSGCGLGFTTGSFNSTLYTNGTVSNLSDAITLVENLFGRILYTNTINLSGINFGSIFTISRNKIGAEATGASGARFNAPATITFLNTGFSRVPLVLHNGGPCPATVCSGQNPEFGSTATSFSGTFAVNVNQFSNYTLVNNSRLVIFDQNDTLGGGILAETYHRILFYANYTRADTNATINNLAEPGADNTVKHNGTCNITIQSFTGAVIGGTRGANLSFDSFSGLYFYESGLFNFTQAGTYRFNISCRANIFEPLNGSDTISIVSDTNSPIRPILFPQILQHPTNSTSALWTYVVGYFNESDINVSINVLKDTYTYSFLTNTTSSIENSIFKGSSQVISHDAVVGQNVTFVNWSASTENLFKSFRFVEFSNHNRTFFYRYAIYAVNRTGDDLRIEFNTTLEKNVPIGTTASLFNNPVPSGWFLINVTLFTGSNRITVWGADASGNAGLSSIDYITAPFSAGAPPKPEVWPLPNVTNKNLDVIGFVNATLLTDLNMTIVNKQGDTINVTYSSGGFRSATANGTTTATQTRSAGSTFVFINESDFTLFPVATWRLMRVEFSNHNRTYWIRYNVTDIQNFPGEDPRLFIDPALEAAVPNGTRISIFNDSHRTGWFNITVSITSLFNGTNEIYAVGNNSNGEGPSSTSQFVFKDLTNPQFDLSTIPSSVNSSTFTVRFNVSDNFQVNLSSVLLNISNSTGGIRYHAVDPSAFNATLSSFGSNIVCSLIHVNGTLANCSVAIALSNNSNRLNFTVKDIATNNGSAQINITAILTSPGIGTVDDIDDITSNLFLFTNWTVTGNSALVDRYEVALGKAPFPNSTYNSEFDFSTVALNRSVNVTHPQNASNFTINLKTGTVYYFSVRLKNTAGDYSAAKSSNGILFSDPSAPVCVGGSGVCVADDGAWSTSNNSLHASWTFTDNESDIVEYTFAIGTAVYPTSGFETIFSRTTTGSSNVTKTSLSLQEGSTYFWSVRARNGNTVLNFTGSYSDYFGSNGITVDTTPPTNGSISYPTANTSANTTVITYTTGHDNASGVSNVSGISSQATILLGRSVLSPGTSVSCPSITDYNPFINVTSGASSIDVNLSHGFCHSFRLRVSDIAGNSRDFTTGAIAAVIASDQTPPATVGSVTDDGFYTYSSSQLHATWTNSSDSETGINHYFFRILVDDPASASDCGGSPPSGCPQINGAGNSTTTQTEVTVFGLNLTHGLKYYFEVTPVNGFSVEGSKTFSDGIIYLDNAPPGQVTVTSVNNDTISADGFLVTVAGGAVNMTALGEPSIDCVLTFTDLDFTTSTAVAKDCNETNVIFNGASRSNITCSNSTNDIQGAFTWYVSCRDAVGNAQTFDQNTHVNFTADWADRPRMNASFIAFGALPLFVTSTAFCNATIFDPDQALSEAHVQFNWTKNNALVRYATGSNITTPFNSTTNVSSDRLALASAVPRGSNLSCEVIVTDNTSLVNRTTVSSIVNNTAPSGTNLTYPLGNNISGNLTFQWFGPSFAGVSDADADGDYMTYEIQIDSETSFNATNNQNVSLFASAELSITGNQINPSVYKNIIVFQDNRNGNWDIYLYNNDTGAAQQIVTSTTSQINPKIYGDYITYEQNTSPVVADLYLYNRNTGLSTVLASAINVSSSDLWGSFVVFTNASGVQLYNISSTSSSTVNTSTTANNTQVYGKLIAWEDLGRTYVFDIISNKITRNSANLSGEPKLFGRVVIARNSTGALFATIPSQGGSDILITTNATTYSIYGSLVTYVNSSATVFYDVFRNVTTVSSSVDRRTIDLYDSFAVSSDGDNISFSRINNSFPTSVFAETPLTSSPSYTLTTRGSTDGTYYWRVVSCDHALENNKCETTGTQSFVVDNTPPTVSVENPTPGKVTGGVVLILTTISDAGVGVANASYIIQNRTDGSVVALDDLVAPLFDNSENFTTLNATNMTLRVTATDRLGNTREAQVNFTVDNNAPFATFGGLGDQTVINDTITNTITANRVKNSTLTVRGPSPSSTVVLVRSQANTTVTNQVLADASNPIPILSLGEGTYNMTVNMTNDLFAGTTDKIRFVIDKTAPQFSQNITIPNGTLFANETVKLSVSWTDSTLSVVNFTYTNSSTTQKMESSGPSTFLTSGVFNSSTVSLAPLINRTFFWNSTASDGLNRTNTTGSLSFFVNDNQPYQNASIPNISVLEDSSNASLSLAAFFKDVNTEGSFSFLDNLSYGIVNATSNVNLSIVINRTTGVMNITALNNFSGNVSVQFNATDVFNKTNSSAAVTIVVIAVNDAPYANATMPNVTLVEDTQALNNISLASFFNDVDNSLAFGIVSTNGSNTTLQITVNETTGNVSFFPRNNFSGVVTAIFNASELNGSLTATSGTVFITVTPVNDPPSSSNITFPLNGSYVGGNITVTWVQATDIDTIDINYSLEFSIDVGSTFSVIAKPIIGIANTSFVWVSTLNITNTTNVTLRINATDGLNFSSAVSAGNFTVDNQAPNITYLNPTNQTLIVGTSSFINVSTSEITNCTFTLNGTTTNLNQTTSRNLSLHTISLSGLAFSHQVINASCVDVVGNRRQKTQEFDARNASISFERGFATPTVLFKNQTVNITLDILSTESLTTLLMSVNASTGAGSKSFTLGDFSPPITQYNRVTYVLFTNTTTIGTRNLTGFNMTHSTVGITPAVIPNAFEIFDPINITLFIT